MALIVVLGVVAPSWLLGTHVLVLLFFHRLCIACISEKAYTGYVIHHRALKTIVDFFDLGFRYTANRPLGEWTIFIVKLILLLFVAPVAFVSPAFIPIEGYATCTVSLLASTVFVAILLYVQQARMINKLARPSHDEVR